MYSTESYKSYKVNSFLGTLNVRHYKSSSWYGSTTKERSRCERVGGYVISFYAHHPDFAAGFGKSLRPLMLEPLRAAPSVAVMAGAMLEYA